MLADDVVAARGRDQERALNVLLALDVLEIDRILPRPVEQRRQVGTEGHDVARFPEELQCLGKA